MPAGSAKIGNPAAVYCRETGYAYQTLEDGAGGQTGVCRLPDAITCNAWELLSGQCGAESDDVCVDTTAIDASGVSGPWSDVRIFKLPLKP